MGVHVFNADKIDMYSSVMKFFSSHFLMIFARVNRCKVLLGCISSACSYANSDMKISDELKLAGFEELKTAPVAKVGKNLNDLCAELMFLFGKDITNSWMNAS